MARLRDVLDRFRPAGTPGAAAVRGVPADRAADQAAELAPIMALLADDELEAQRIREQAVHQAEQRQAQGATRAAALVDEARRESSAVRARIASEAREQAARDRQSVRQAAESMAESLHRKADLLMPDYVARVKAELEIILRDLGDAP